MVHDVESKIKEFKDQLPPDEVIAQELWKPTVSQSLPLSTLLSPSPSLYPSLPLSTLLPSLFPFHTFFPHSLFPLHFSPSLSDEDDTAELLRELQKIRKERKEEQEKQVGCHVAQLPIATIDVLVSLRSCTIIFNLWSTIQS